MSLTLTIYQANQTVLTYINAQDELICYKLKDNSKPSIKLAISLILKVPKKSIKLNGNNAISIEYERQMSFTLGILKEF